MVAVVMVVALLSFTETARVFFAAAPDEGGIPRGEGGTNVPPLWVWDSKCRRNLILGVLNEQFSPWLWWQLGLGI